MKSMCFLTLIGISPINCRWRHSSCCWLHIALRYVQILDALDYAKDVTGIPVDNVAWIAIQAQMEQEDSSPESKAHGRSGLGATDEQEAGHSAGANIPISTPPDQKRQP